MIKRNQCPSIFSAPFMRELRVIQLKEFDQRNNSNTVGHHSQCVYLCHTPPYYVEYWPPHPLLALQERNGENSSKKNNKLQRAINGGPSKKFWSILLKAFFASTIKKPHFYSVELDPQIDWTMFTALSITAFNPAHSWSSLHAWVAPDYATLSTHYWKRQRHVYPNPTIRTPDSL